MLALGFAKRSTSEPPKKATAYAVSDDPKAKKRICHEFKLGKCSKGDDCVYEHVAAAPEGDKKEKRPPKGAPASPAIFLGEDATEECYLAACKDRRVTFPKLKIATGGKKQYQIDQHPLKEVPLRQKDPQAGNVHSHIAIFKGKNIANESPWRPP